MKLKGDYLMLKLSRLNSCTWWWVLIAATIAITTPICADGGEVAKESNRLIAYWNFDQGTDTEFVDSSGNGHGGKVFGATRVAGIAGTGLRFDGAHSYALTDDSDVMNGISNHFTIEAWIHPEMLNIRTPLVDIVGTSTCRLRVSQQLISIAIMLDGSWTGADVDVQIFPKKWHHLVVTYDGKLLTTYRNGVKVSAEGRTGSLSPGGPVVLGCADPAQKEGWFNGIIDEVKVYNKALTGREVLSSYLSHQGSARANAQNVRAVGRQTDIPPVAVRKRTHMTPTIALSGSLLTLENSHYRLILSVKDGMLVRELLHKRIGTNVISSPSQSLFRLITNESDFAGFAPGKFELVNASIKKGKGGVSTARITLSSAQREMLLTISATVDDSPELQLSATIKNISNKTQNIRFAFPVLEGVNVGNDLERNYYLYPYGGGLIDNKPVSLIGMYGAGGISRALWLQLLDVYNERLNAGVYLRGNENNPDIYKYLALYKSPSSADDLPMHSERGFGNFNASANQSVDDYAHIFGLSKGVGMACGSVRRSLSPGNEFFAGKYVIGVHEGNWRSAMGAYMKWVKTWYVARQRPAWIKHVYQHRAFHPQHYYDVKNNRWILNQTVNELDDEVQIWAWWNWEKRDNAKSGFVWFTQGAGSYDYSGYHTEWGGLKALKEQIVAAQKRGKRIGLYFGPTTLSGLERQVGSYARDWALEEPKGRTMDVYDFTSQTGVNVYDTCPAVTEFQDHVVSTVARVARETGVDEIYLDVYGAQGVATCDNPLHHHNTPEVWIRGEIELRKKVLAALAGVGKQISLMTEDVGSDYMSQYVDMGFYSQWKFLNNGFTNLFRFYFPAVKMIDLFDESNPADYNIAFYNGDGWHGFFDDEKLKPLLRRLGRCAHENSDAFNCVQPVPLIETRTPKVYANKFPLAHKIIYTVYNDGSTGTKARFVASAKRHTHFVDLFGHRELIPNTEQGACVVSLDLPAKEAGCVGQFVRAIQLRRQAEGITVGLSELSRGSYLKLIGLAGGKEEKIPVNSRSVQINLRQYGESAEVDLVIQLLDADGFLIDEVVSVR